MAGAEQRSAMMFLVHHPSPGSVVLKSPVTLSGPCEILRVNSDTPWLVYPTARYLALHGSGDTGLSPRVSLAQILSGLHFLIQLLQGQEESWECEDLRTPKPTPLLPPRGLAQALGWISVVTQNPGNPARRASQHMVSHPAIPAPHR